ncbi:hypothetical protein PCASD_24293 [Puccinia coronata f. sp. avenae]|uniref:Uncharacterized protein n=1 Tax=Puccinia coronata f. sp. avenae TaxID=200324 RepID=A0A2N5TU60_9BASI|nr:hypothetical protein PCASD_24293 [Puccinia coronata f. sp. avenae]
MKDIQSFGYFVVSLGLTPGVSTFAPTNPSAQFDPLAGLDFIEVDNPPDQDNPALPPSPSSQEVLDWWLSEDEFDLDSPLIDVGSFFPPTKEEYTKTPSSPPSAPSRPKPGFDILLTSNKAPEDISLSIDKSNSLHTKRWANLAHALATTEIPQTYREAMLSADADCWSKAVEEELSAMERLHV